uniref:Uncharacterized protein n=1 Tax=Anguilla anguilla TaxID=7936 RepID=A0A0E9TTF8_ANGAN
MIALIQAQEIVGFLHPLVWSVTATHLILDSCPCQLHKSDRLQLFIYLTRIKATWNI